MTWNTSKEAVLKRFFAKVEKSPEPNGCWLWKAAVNHNGYGFFKHMNKQRKAHRFSYEQFVGPIPDGLMVCHKCDTPACVNPLHLFLGTNSENLMDASRKNRIARGERNGWARLTAEQVEEIRRIYHPIKGGRPKGEGLRKSIAEQFGVSQQTIYRIVKREQWNHLESD